MPGLASVFKADVGYLDGYVAPTCTLDGRAHSRRLSPDGVSLWVVEAEVEQGASLSWDEEHGDEAVYVMAGAIQQGTHRCPPGGAVIIEAGAPATLYVSTASALAHFGPTDTQPRQSGTVASEDRVPAVHLVGPRGTYEMVSAGRETRFFADSTCPTCSITLMYTARDSKYSNEAHSHSQDEILYLMGGEIMVGKERLGSGDALFVAADRRYRFDSGEAGFGFLNYRSGPSTYLAVRGRPPFKEGGAINGFTFVNDVR